MGTENYVHCPKCDTVHQLAMCKLDKDYNAPELVELRKGQGDPIVMYLIVRESLKMGPGKIGAQCGHAASMVVLDYVRKGGLIEPPAPVEGPVAINRYEVQYDPFSGEQIYVPKSPETLAAEDYMDIMFQWLQTSFRKVTVKADDKEWEKVKACPDIRYSVVRDAGFTEVAAGSETVIGVWPMYKSKAPKIIKRLQVL
jgi:peptidyl-tRNA hydrolase